MFYASRIPIVEGVALDEYEDGKCYIYRIPKDIAEIHSVSFAKIAALPSFLRNLGLHQLQLVRSK
jgi:hypothetical protein